MSYIGNTKIGKMYLGSNEIGKAYLGNNLVFQKGGTPGGRIPAGYTERAYVQTDSSAWIDTGIAGATDLEIAIRFCCTKYIQYGAVFGNYVDESHNVNRAILFSNTELIAANGTNLSTIVAGYSTNRFLFLKVTSSSAYLDGASTSISPDSKTANTGNICLGNRSTTNPVSRDIGLRIAYFSIKKNGTTVLEYIPCTRDLDSEPGFYDTVNNTFVLSLTGTSFTAGPSGVKFYDRLSFDGTAYIDTGITPADNSSYSANFGDETMKSPQRLFRVATGSTYQIAVFLSSSTSSTNRNFSVYYGGPAITGNHSIAFSTARYNIFLTPNRFGYGSTVRAITKTANAPTEHLFIGQTSLLSGQPFTGSMGTFCIHGSDASGATTFAGLSEYTPTKTLQPCRYNGADGLWNIEDGTFLGNSAGSGTLSATNIF